MIHVSTPVREVTWIHHLGDLVLGYACESTEDVALYWESNAVARILALISVSFTFSIVSRIIEY